MIIHALVGFRMRIASFTVNSLRARVAKIAIHDLIYRLAEYWYHLLARNSASYLIRTRYIFSLSSRFKLWGYSNPSARFSPIELCEGQTKTYLKIDAHPIHVRNQSTHHTFESRFSVLTKLYKRIIVLPLVAVLSSWKWHGILFRETKVSRPGLTTDIPIKVTSHSSHAREQSERVESVTQVSLSKIEITSDCSRQFPPQRIFTLVLIETFLL